MSNAIIQLAPNQQRPLAVHNHLYFATLHQVHPKLIHMRPMHILPPLQTAQHLQQQCPCCKPLTLCSEEAQSGPHPYETKCSYHSQRSASSTMSTAAMPMLKMTAALLSPATAASLKWAYTMHMDTKLKKKSPQSRSQSWATGLGSVCRGRVGLIVAPVQGTAEFVHYN